ncbi:mRNA surveillance protein pelota [Coccidioides immitis RS]|uniref:Protein DOM34 homolog n=3 Tax=Coccidioides immitis TaxID=5501 RepID=J3KDT8_COCIM|nr:mRNA surveillance protein pelota [Coccidioides immitis RS]EAS33562.3 mRNA surveillance protein pelota [Coccidioides immitis RS]KMP04742.1 translation release factor eRF1 [Coccidioides immitis RMSCC 2394]KMU77507.1 pelota-PA [Coccidioides immitis RMSCC 3703]TPX21242.1 Translation factor pelota [Coccidioides immitis]
MRLIKQNIEQDGSGSVTLFPEEPEDMWHAYNLIRPHDLLKASAIRRVTTTATTGTTSSSRVHLTLQIRVKSLDFDPQSSQLHVSGQIASENPYTKIGQHHTLDLELQRNFTLEKRTESGEVGGWDSVAIEMLKDAVDEGYKRRAEAVAVVMQEGLANICFIGQFQTVLKQKVEMTIPRKRQGGSDHDKALAKFFQVTLETLLRLLDTSAGSITSSTTSNGTSTRPILLASPGFTAVSFQKHIQSVSLGKPELKPLLESMIVVHSSSGHVHSLAEVLKSPSVQARLSNTKYARETAIMDTFFNHLRMDTNKATYGAKEVESAVEQGAVGRGGGILLISNRLFRAQDVHERKRWVSLVDRVRDVEGGEVRVLSSDHESGKRLDGLGGVAALLTFPVLDDENEEDDGDDNADG